MTSSLRMAGIFILLTTLALAGMLNRITERGEDRPPVCGLELQQPGGLGGDLQRL